MAKKYVYFFGNGKADATVDMKEIVGGKGANLAEMTKIGVPVPEGFTISTEACDMYYKIGKKKLFTTIRPDIIANMKKVETATGKTFGKGPNPLLVSVRSGAALSMPGMMDTVLNLGLNQETVDAMIELTGNEKFVLDAYRRFIQMFGDVVMNVAHHDFEAILASVRKSQNVENDNELTVENLRILVTKYKALYKKVTKKNFPEDPMEQLEAGVNAVFGSWNNPRAIKYREINEIRGLLGTAVNVQAMVFGNAGDDCSTGVCFTRDPSTGENKYFYGEYLINAQGEDVVAGIRTPQQITIKGSKEWAKNLKVSESKRKKEFASLEETMPSCFKELDDIRIKLEKHYREMQDMEFTIEHGKLYMLQTRSGKRTATAHVQIAVDMLKEKLITEETAVLRVPPEALDQLLHPVFDTTAEKQAKAIGKGLPASPGAATGRVVFEADVAEAWVAKGEQVILVRVETSPEDIGGMNVANGILTARGGMTSHAAVVARGMGTCCVAGCGDIQIDYKTKKVVAKGKTLKEGDWMSLNGSTGTVYSDQIKTVEPKLTGSFKTIMDLSDKYRTLGVRTNADTPADAKVAVSFGAEGIGLCRTEHMFFEGSRIVSFRKLILVAEDVKNLQKDLQYAEGAERKALEKELAGPLKQYNKALSELLPLQRKDFIDIFKALKGKACTIRFLDPPLHEFLPHDAKGQQKMAKEMNVKPAQIKRIVGALHEFNPMLGHRGCRLGITYPEVTKMQAQAVAEAAIAVKGSKAEIMIPLVGAVKELTLQKELVLEAIAEVKKAKNVKNLDITIGTMIEVPRAAVIADKIAAEADFFSFGTNDLTQMGCGFSRDDAGKFLKEYVDLGVYEYDPFQVLDMEGIGEFVKIAIERGRKTKKDLKLGICGEHGGEPKSVEFCHNVGLDYVSCSPFRVPIARLAAAQAAIKAKK